MKKILLLFIILLLSSVAMASNIGPEKITITGEKRGPVTLQHRKHQTIVSTCLTCHSHFPKTKNGLKDAIKSGDIKQKFVMNKVCIKCHRSLKSAGKKHGPTSCNDCHK